MAHIAPKTEQVFEWERGRNWIRKKFEKCKLNLTTSIRFGSLPARDFIIFPTFLCICCLPYQPESSVPNWIWQAAWISTNVIWELLNNIVDWMKMIRIARALSISHSGTKSFSHSISDMWTDFCIFAFALHIKTVMIDSILSFVCIKLSINAGLDIDNDIDIIQDHENTWKLRDYDLMVSTCRLRSSSHLSSIPTLFGWVKNFTLFILKF